mmetsp:Transcript_6945/g.21941  ORF Transcript_6945/g.21941 Transcript_6945/m.21941 type:complete len:90 (+) Transcript_6945:434-703(+)
MLRRASECGWLMPRWHRSLINHPCINIRAKFEQKRRDNFGRTPVECVGKSAVERVNTSQEPASAGTIRQRESRIRAMEQELDHWLLVTI